MSRFFVFDDIDHHDRWRADPDHRAAQRRAITDFYAEYRIAVGAVFHRPPAPVCRPRVATSAPTLGSSEGT